MRLMTILRFAALLFLWKVRKEAGVQLFCILIWTPITEVDSVVKGVGDPEKHCSAQSLLNFTSNQMHQAVVSLTVGVWECCSLLVEICVTPSHFRSIKGSQKSCSWIFEQQPLPFLSDSYCNSELLNSSVKVRTASKTACSDCTQQSTELGSCDVLRSS